MRAKIRMKQCSHQASALLRPEWTLLCHMPGLASESVSDSVIRNTTGACDNKANASVTCGVADIASEVYSRRPPVPWEGQGRTRATDLERCLSMRFAHTGAVGCWGWPLPLSLHRTRANSGALSELVFGALQQVHQRHKRLSAFQLLHRDHELANHTSGRTVELSHTPDTGTC